MAPFEDDHLKIEGNYIRVGSYFNPPSTSEVIAIDHTYSEVEVSLLSHIESFLRLMPHLVDPNFGPFLAARQTIKLNLLKLTFSRYSTNARWTSFVTNTMRDEGSPRMAKRGESTAHPSSASFVLPSTPSAHNVRSQPDIDSI